MTSWNPTRLFSNRSVEQETSGKWSHLQREIGAADEATLAEPDNVREIIERQIGGPVPELQRERATFPLDTVGATTVVQVVLPYTGSSSYFWVKPSSATRTPVVEAQVESSGFDRPDTYTLTLRNTWPSGVEPATVKAWARERVDLIEAYLTALRDEFAEADRELRQEAESLAANRLQGLRNERVLAEGLGEGI
ncbi:hypothetical protein [Blastococcus mobilis]|uniref:Uncharacterized protein n=1 Tax=Blastococcus mobilis TaxID=1938746 RepID=A0A238VQG4_9ACTN|nr:hypothetical protein [Blastococcus mobilis]SNR35729.1 hypothetical protein SAMN06272737_1049 [Blastococcus mobilis]